MAAKFLFRLFVILLIFVTGKQVGISQQGQKGMLTGDFSAGPAVNLTKVLESMSDQSISGQIGDNVTLDVKHDRRSSEKARQIAVRLRSSIARLVDILRPTGSTTIRLFVARLDKVPPLYEILTPADVDFVYPVVYDSDTDIDSNCDGITKLCDTIYRSIPHELTHHFLDGKLANDATWLNEGLAEYVSGLVSSELSPKQAFKREVETLPEVSLNSAQIRRNLLEWNYTPETLTPESVLYYGAAHQLVRVIVAEAERQKIPEPLQKLLVFLKIHKGNLRSEEAVQFIQEHLKVEVKTLGVLDIKRKNEILETAMANFWRERNTRLTGYKYNALVTFAYLDTTLPDSLLAALFEEVFDKKNSRHFQCLSAKALTLRLDQFAVKPTHNPSPLYRLQLKKFGSLPAFKEHLSGVCKN